MKPSFCQKNPSTYSNFRTDLNLSFRKKGAPLWYKRTPLILSSLFWAASSNFSRSVLLSSEVHPSTTSVKWLENKSKPSIILLSYYFLGLGLPLPAPPTTWFSSPLVYPSKTRSWPFCYAFTLGFIFRSFYTLHNGHLFCPLWVCSPVSIRAGLVWLAGGRRHCGRWAGARGLMGCWAGAEWPWRATLSSWLAAFMLFHTLLAALIRRALAELLSLDSWLPRWEIFCRFCYRTKQLRVWNENT